MAWSKQLDTPIAQRYYPVAFYIPSPPDGAPFLGGIALKRLLILAAFLMPGCLTPNPSLSKGNYVPDQQVPNPDGNARAFRVDIEEMERPEPKARYTLTQIPFDESDWLRYQYNPHPLTTVEWIGQNRESGPTKYSSAKMQAECSVLVRVYRPGYRIIEIRPGDPNNEWKWIAANIFDQEKAIEELLGVPRTEDRLGWWENGPLCPCSEVAGMMTSTTLGDSGLLPGSASPKHRDVLLFGASEYDRLAVSFTADLATLQKFRDRLEWKAQRIREYAER